MSPLAREYGQNLIDYIKKRHIDKDNIDFNVALILKLTKYCNRHNLSSDDLVDFIVNNLNRFKVIF